MLRDNTFVFTVIWILFTNICLSALDIELEYDGSKKDEGLPSIIMKCADDAYNQNLLGLDALKIKKYDEAIKHFKMAFSLLPGYWDAENNRGVAYYRKGNIPIAKKIWEDIVEKDPKYAIAIYNLGEIEFRKKNYEQARILFKKSLKKRRNFISAMVMLGQIDILDKDYNSALSILAKAFKIDPENQEIWGTYAYALIQSGDTAKAELILLKQKQNPGALQLLGQIALARKNYDKAIGLLKKSVSLGGDATLLYHTANAELERGSCENALEILETYFKRGGRKDVNAWITAGIAAKECKKISLAKDYFSRGITSYPRDPILKYNLGQIYFYERKYEKAEDLWKSLSDTLQDPTLFHFRAIAAKHLGRLTSAESLIRKAIKRDIRSEYFDFLGVVLYQQGKKSEAIAQFKKALAIEPANQSAQLNLALANKTPEGLNESIQFVKMRLDTCQYECNTISLELSILYYHQERISDAIDILLKIPEKKRSEKIYRHLGIYLSNQQKWDDAISVLQKAKKFLVLEQQTEAQLIDYYMKAGYYGKAIQAIKDLLTIWDSNLWRLYYQLGYAYLEQNNLKVAIQYFDKSLKCKYKNPAARGMLAFVYNRMGNSEKARKLWERNLKDDPDNPTLWINMGLLLEKDGNYLDAIDRYEKSSSLDRSNKAIYLNIGNAYTALNRHREARMSYSMALDSPKRELAAYNSFLSAHREHNRPVAKKMITILETEYGSSDHYKRAKAEMLLWDADTLKALSLLESIPKKNHEDKYVLAKVYIFLKNAEKAEFYCNDIPNNDDWQKERSILFASLSFIRGDYQSAYNQFSNLHDTSYVFNYNKALSAYKAGKYFEAIKIIDPFIKNIFGKDKADTYRLIGNSAFAMKQWENARSSYLQLSVIELQNPVVQYNLAVASYNLDNMKDAWKYYKNARALDSTLINKDIENKYHAMLAQENDGMTTQDTLTMLFNQAVDHQKYGRDSLAETFYFSILDQDGGHVQSLNNLGTIYAARADYKKSEKFYKKAIQKKKNMSEAYANLIRIYIATNELTRAQSLLEKAKRLVPYDILLIQVENELNDSLTNMKSE